MIFNKFHGHVVSDQNDSRHAVSHWNRLVDRSPTINTFVINYDFRAVKVKLFIMYHLMSLKCRILSKKFLFIMYHLMSLKCGILSKTFPTSLTAMWFLSRMNQYMLSQTGTLVKSSATSQTCVRFVSRM